MYKFTNKETGAQVSAMKFTPCCLDRRFTESLIFDNFAKSLSYSADENYIRLYGAMYVSEGDWIVKNSEGFYFPITEEELFSKYNLLNSFKSHKYDTSVVIVPWYSNGQLHQQIKLGDGSCEIKGLQLSDDTLTSPIPTVMVDGCTEMMDKIAAKTIEEYKKTTQHGIHTTNQ